MHRILLIESGVRGLLWVNGQFCGPAEAQAFPAAENAEIFIQLFPFEGMPMALEMELREGRVARLSPQERGYALCWPDGVIQLELRPDAAAEPAQESAQVASGALLRYLTLRLAGDERAAQLLMRPNERVDLPPYDAVVPLRFAPLRAPERFDERAGLVTRLAPNVARVDAALAMTSPAGQGRRLIERIEIM